MFYPMFNCKRCIFPKALYNSFTHFSPLSQELTSQIGSKLPMLEMQK